MILNKNVRNYFTKKPGPYSVNEWIKGWINFLKSYKADYCGYAYAKTK